MTTLVIKKKKKKTGRKINLIVSFEVLDTVIPKARLSFELSNYFRIFFVSISLNWFLFLAIERHSFNTYSENKYNF